MHTSQKDQFSPNSDNSELHYVAATGSHLQDLAELDFGTQIFLRWRIPETGNFKKVQDRAVDSLIAMSEVMAEKLAPTGTSANPNALSKWHAKMLSYLQHWSDVSPEPAFRLYCECFGSIFGQKSTDAQREAVGKQLDPPCFEFAIVPAGRANSIPPGSFLLHGGYTLFKAPTELENCNQLYEALSHCIPQNELEHLFSSVNPGALIKRNYDQAIKNEIDTKFDMKFGKVATITLGCTSLILCIAATVLESSLSRWAILGGGATFFAAALGCLMSVPLKLRYEVAAKQLAKYQIIYDTTLAVLGLSQKS